MNRRGRGYLAVAVVLTAAMLVTLGVERWRDGMVSRADGSGGNGLGGGRDRAAALPDGWDRVDLGSMEVSSLAPAAWLEGPVVAGADGDDAVAYKVSPDGARQELNAPEDPQLGTGRATVVQDGLAGIIRVTEGTRTDVAWFAGGDWWSEIAVPAGEDGRAPTRLVPVVQDENAYLGAVGIMPSDRGRELRAWWDNGRWSRLNRDSLVLDGEGRLPDVFAAATEVQITAVVQSAEAVRAWTIAAYPNPHGRRPRWHALPDPPLDRVTDLSWWALDTWIVGHRDGRPKVVKIAGDDRYRALPVPDVELDDERPLVRVLTPPFRGEPLLLALQTRDGIEIWARRSGRWVRRSGPDGVLVDGTLIGDRIYLVVDGDLVIGPAPVAR